MRILVVTAAPALPQMFGGSQRTSNALIKGLIDRGHHVELLAGFRRVHWVGVRNRILFNLLGKPAIADRVLGYRTWRSWHPWDAVAQVVDAVRPDIALVLAHKPTIMARAVLATGTPVLLALQDVEFKDQGDDYAALSHVQGVANSKYTADRYRERFGIISRVIYPIIRQEDYLVQPSGDAVTFVTPDPRKGLEIAISVSRACPDIPFLFVDGWPIDPEVRRILVGRLAALGNVGYSRSMSDMRDVYRRTRVMLVPSMWEEGYGRVASEAQISGIPVVGSDRGGLPEAIGAGGIIIPVDAPIERWASAVRAAWNEGGERQSLIAAARAHAQRPSLDPAVQFAAWEQALIDAAVCDGFAAHTISSD